MQLTWIDVKKASVAARVTDDGAWSITNHAPSDGGKWELFRETGQRKYFGEFDTLADAKAEAERQLRVGSESSELPPQ